MIKMLLKWLNHLWFDDIKEEQRKYRKDHILNKYDPDDWKDEQFW